MGLCVYTWYYSNIFFSWLCLHCDLNKRWTGSGPHPVKQFCSLEATYFISPRKGLFKALWDSRKTLNCGHVCLTCVSSEETKERRNEMRKYIFREMRRHALSAVETFDGVSKCTHVHCADTNKGSQLSLQSIMFSLCSCHLFNKHLHTSILYLQCVLLRGPGSFLLSEYIMLFIHYLYLLIFWLWMHNHIIHWKWLIRLNVSGAIWNDATNFKAKAQEWPASNMTKWKWRLMI